MTDFIQRGEVWVSRPFGFDVQEVPGGYLVTFDDVSYEENYFDQYTKPRRVTALWNTRVNKGEVKWLKNRQFFVSEDAEATISVGFSSDGQYPHNPAMIDIGEYLKKWKAHRESLSSLPRP